MSKTITLRIKDDIYKIIKTAADGNKRTISDFLKYATMSYLSQNSIVSDEEMNEIMNDDELLKSIKFGEKEIEEGQYKVV
ncbi:MAG: CopG family transcriptional regulator [Candidatus Marinimicrobia bacterium]|nr:CopG family transcriptional regulator [Candidatus Neomarinimicrobiota bacterium]